MSESSVPVPRPSEGTRLTKEGRAALVEVCRRVVDDPAATDDQKAICGINLQYEATVAALEAELARRSPSVPTAPQELQVAGMPIRVDPSVPPNEIQAWQNGRCVFRLVNIHDNEMLKVPSLAVPSSEDARNEHAPKCECGEVATCYGAYENQEPEFSCDECCGHGNEDGWCKHFSDMPTLTARLRELRASEEAANSDTDRLNWLDAEAKRLLKRDPLGLWPHSRPRVVLAAEEVFNAGGDIRKAIDAARVQGENSQ